MSKFNLPISATNNNADYVKSCVDKMDMEYKTRIQVLESKIEELSSGDELKQVKQSLNNACNILNLCVPGVDELTKILDGRDMTRIKFTWANAPGIGLVLSVYEDNTEIWDSVKYL